MYKSTIKYSMIFGALFSVVFLIARVLISPTLSYYLLSYKEISFFLKLFLSMGIHLSLEWSWMVFNLLLKGVSDLDIIFLKNL